MLLFKTSTAQKKNMMCHLDTADAFEQAVYKVVSIRINQKENELLLQTYDETAYIQ